MYADRITASMAQAIDETTRRRDRQIAYNTEHGIDPTPLRKRISDVTDMLAREDLDTAELLKGGYRRPGRGGPTTPSGAGKGRPARASLSDVPAAELADLIQELTDQMHGAAGELQFELAARLRDEISGLKKELRQMQAATA
jgi:excinuclease ABC subunit B